MRAFVGRDQELAVFRAALTDRTRAFTVIYFHGPGGIGKSTLLVRLADEDFALFSTADSGQTWHRRGTRLPWPQPVPVGAPFGLVVRPDGALLAWLDSSPTITYLESTDGGGSFRVSSAGPGGPVVWVSDGYVALGNQPSVSRNAANWARTPISVVPPPSG